jgi:dienelactone hydrolase
MENADVDFQFIAYEGAKHSFTNPEADNFAKKFGMPLAYNEAADKKSWEDMQAFFKKIFAK